MDFKERIIISPQGRDYNFNRRNCFEFCSNNYLDSSHPEVVQAAYLRYPWIGMSSVRFICGTQDIHKTLEKISDFTEDTILYAAALMQTEFFEPVLEKGMLSFQIV
jgi:glycine C-acetyltransferase